MSDLTQLTIAEAHDGLSKKTFSATELARAYLVAMEKGRKLNAYVLETPEKALEMAAASDARIAKGEIGPLEGIPLGVKDLFCTKGARTTGLLDTSSAISCRPTSRPSPANLWRDGAVMLGKLNNDEFAMGSSNETSCFGGVEIRGARVGDNRKLVPGGSSGGSAAVVAAYIGAGQPRGPTPAARSASRRRSAASSASSRPMAAARAGASSPSRSSLDQAGPDRPRRSRTAPMLLQGMRRPRSPRIRRCVAARCPTSPRRSRNVDIKGLRVGIPKEYRVDGTAAEIVAALGQGHSRCCEAAGAVHRSRCRCRTPNTPFRPTTSWRRRRPRRTWRAMTACASACAMPGKDLDRHVREDARRGFRQGGASGAS